MRHSTGEDLLAHYTEPSDAIARHLAECPVCAAEFEKLRLSLETFRSPVPEPDDAFETRMWSRLEERLIRHENVQHRTTWWRWRPARLTAAMALAAALLIGVFFAGRVSVQPEPVMSEAQVRDRVLLVTLREHLDRSQVVLIELSNADPARGGLLQRDAAEDLLASNRLLRQAATGAGRPGVAATLEDLERVLMEIAHSPAEGFADRLEDIRRQMEDEGILFRVRVLSTNLKNPDKWRF